MILNLLPTHQPEDDLALVIQTMLATLQDNIDQGFDADIELVFDYATNGLTSQTYNMLIHNFNEKIRSHNALVGVDTRSKYTLQ